MAFSHLSGDSRQARDHKRGQWRAIAALASVLSAAATLCGQTLPPATELKQLRLAQLLDLEVTSVSRRPEKLQEAASAVQVITADDISRSAATSLQEALRLASNVEAAQIDSRQWAITARGFNNVFADKMLVMIDGRSVYTPLFAGVYWDTQSVMLEDLDRIEVISGPGATQWGANAVNGVINITSKSAKDTQGGIVVEGVGTTLRNESELRYGGRLGHDAYYRVYARYFDRGDSERTSGSTASDAWHGAQVGFRADWEQLGDSTVTVQGDAFDSRMGQVGPDNIRASSGNLLGRWTRQLHEGDFKFETYVDHTHRRMPGSFTQDIDTFDFDFQHHRPWRRHDLLWGFGYRVNRDSVVNTPSNAFLPAEVTRQWVNAFIQDEVAIIPERWRVTAGTKVEHNDYTGFEFEPSIRSAWTPDRRQTIWAAMSRAVRTPSRIDRDLFSPATPPYRVAGGRNVVSEKLIAYEAGYRLQLTPRFAASLAAYYNGYDDLRSIEPLNPPAAFPIEQTSGLRGQSEGVEATLDWTVNSAWRIRAGWTELRVHSEPQPGNLARPTRDSIVRDPRHWATLRSSWDLARFFELDADLRWVAPIASQGVPEYTEANVRFGWQVSDSIDVSLIGQNLLNDRHTEFNPAGARRYLSRAVFAKVTWRL
jgi:iron complex outermembrane receptor protein